MIIRNYYRAGEKTPCNTTQNGAAESLAADLLAHYIHKAATIKRIRRTTDYRSEYITVTYDNGDKAEYVRPAC